MREARGAVIAKSKEATKSKLSLRFAPPTAPVPEFLSQHAQPVALPCRYALAVSQEVTGCTHRNGEDDWQGWNVGKELDGSSQREKVLDGSAARSPCASLSRTHAPAMSRDRSQMQARSCSLMRFELTLMQGMGAWQYWKQGDQASDEQTRSGCSMGAARRSSWTKPGGPITACHAIWGAETGHRSLECSTTMGAASCQKKS
eukprot:3252991-Rhodomonas_salina.1